ncbi:MAG: Sb-PDE family phosphodiesterase [Ignavibacteria bacterium]|nr:Sb-PDE family phosphodiesterase [Ignavibacteria bacterium]
MKKRDYFLITILFLWLLLSSLPTTAQKNLNNKKNLYIPDIEGYITLKCDFHIHTSFSDGVVWPSYRVEEAWMDGLDAISITDHIEYTPHKEYLKVDHNAPYELAINAALIHDILLIKGTEITKSHPGHFNALFIEDASKIENDDYKAAILEANKQGAFVILNHPRDAVSDNYDWWIEEFDVLFENKQLHGIEIFNWNDYYPSAFNLALEKEMTLFSSSDIHKGSEYYKNLLGFDHRPMTLVFVKERSIEGIKEALKEGRTSGYFKNAVYGKEMLVKQLFQNSVKIGKAHHFDTRGNAFFKITNTSDIPYLLIPEEKNKDTGFFELVLEAKRTSILSVPVKEKEESVTIRYVVDNVLINANEKLKVDLVFERE